MPTKININDQNNRSNLEYQASWKLHDIVQYLKRSWLIIKEDKAVFLLNLLNEPLIPTFTIKVDTRQAKLMMLKMQLHNEMMDLHRKHINQR